MTIQQTIIARHLRNYYNECMEVNEDFDNELCSFQEAEGALIQLDEKYAKIIDKEI